jgi:hypothetical protein
MSFEWNLSMMRHNGSLTTNRWTRSAALRPPVQVSPLREGRRLLRLSLHRMAMRPLTRKGDRRCKAGHPLTNGEVPKAVGGNPLRCG